MGLNFINKTISLNDNDVKGTITFALQFDLNDNTESEPTPPPHTSSNMWDGISDIVYGKYITATGAYTSSPYYYYVETYFPVVAGKSYVFWGESKDDKSIAMSNRIFWYKEDMTFISRNAFTNYTKTVGIAPEDAKYLRICASVEGNKEVTQELLNSYNWYIGEGDADTEFVPY